MIFGLDAAGGAGGRDERRDHEQNKPREEEANVAVHRGHLEQ